MAAAAAAAVGPTVGQCLQRHKRNRGQLLLLFLLVELVRRRRQRVQVAAAEV